MAKQGAHTHLPGKGPGQEGHAARHQALLLQDADKITVDATEGHIWQISGTDLKHSETRI